MGHHAWRVRPQRLDRSWSITAGIDGGRLTSVKHYESKLRAVGEFTKPLRVITAAPETRELGATHGVEVRVLDTLGAAIRATQPSTRGSWQLSPPPFSSSPRRRSRSLVRFTELAAAKRDAATTLMQSAPPHSTSTRASLPCRLSQPTTSIHPYALRRSWPRSSRQTRALPGSLM